MAKDPAFLFYSADFLVGTMTMNDSQVGAYIRLMCLQHQSGHISAETLDDMRGEDPCNKVLKKFVKDGYGLFYNVRLEKEIEKRAEYSKSRSRNRLAKKSDMYCSRDEHMIDISKSHEQHMVNEDEDVIKDINIPTKNEVGRKEDTEFGAVSIDEGWLRVEEAFEKQIGPLPYGEYIARLQEMYDALGADVVIIAIKEANRKQPKNMRSYLTAILENWARDEITTPEKARAAIADHERENKAPEVQRERNEADKYEQWN